MRTSLALALALLAAGRARAAGPDLTPLAAAQLDEGVKRLYALDYARSRAAFRRIVEAEPDNPFGYLFEAGGIWWQASQEYGLFQSTPALQGVFEEDVGRAVRKAEVLIAARDPRARADGYFAAGMALGTLGQWRLMKRRWLDAYFAGKKAVKYLKKCKKLDPDYYEADLGLGVFDYQAARLSGIAKLGILLGLGGDEKRGLEEIESAAARSRYAREQADVFLLSIYLIDLKDYARALPIAERLRAGYPESPYYAFVDALLRERLGDWDGSVEAGRALYAQASADPAAFRPKWLTLVCGLSGPDCLAKDDLDRLISWLDHAIAATGAEKPSGFQTLLHLFRGDALDVLGRREEALAEYEKVLVLPPFDFARARALQCRASPCGRDEVLGRLKRLSEAPPAVAAREGNGNATPTR